MSDDAGMHAWGPALPSPVLTQGATVAGWRARNGLRAGLTAADYIERRSINRGGRSAAALLRGQGRDRGRHGATRDAGHTHARDPYAASNRGTRAVPALDLGRIRHTRELPLRGAWRQGELLVAESSGAGPTRCSKLNRHFRSIVFGEDITHGAPASARAHPDAQDARLAGPDVGARCMHSARAHLTMAGQAKAVLNQSGRP